MFVTECFHNKCLNCQPCVQFILSPRCESDMILSVMTIRKKLFNSKYPQLLVAKDFAVAEKKNSISLSVEENMIQERKHLRKDVPQMLKQQIPNHQLHRISHKTSPSLNNSHKASPPLNNNHKVKQPLILNRNLSHHNSAMMTNFQMHLPQPQRLLR